MDNKGKTLLAVSLAIIVVLSGFALIFYLQLSDLQAQKKTLEAQVANFQESNNGLIDKLNAFQNKINELTNQTINLSNQVESSLNLVSNMTSHIKQLENQLNISQAEVQELEEKISNLQLQNEQLREQNGLLQNQTVRILNFTLDGYDNPVGLVWSTKFIVEIQNNEPREIENATLTFNILSSFDIARELSLLDSQHNVIDWSLSPKEPFIMGVLKQGVTLLRGVIWNSLDDSAKLRGSTFVATLKLGDYVLDEASIEM
jgi:cell division protein FtsB